ncbi:phosphatase 2C-like domain-containing protein [Xylariaceae sp. FL0662B]|nr:phosphatase 2C-like domain-containing protein [Xylariaceae sp. FL0662B]
MLANNHIPDLNGLGLSDCIAYRRTPTSEDVTKLLNQRAFALIGAPNVTRYDGAQLPSNNPCEDNLMHGSFSNPFDQGVWMAWAVFDGHSGWQTSDLLTRHLIPYVRLALGNIERKDGEEVPEQAIHTAIQLAFVYLDKALVNSSIPTINNNLRYAEIARRLEAAYSGSCALLTLFDPSTRKLRVASTGDSRAVLGQSMGDGTWSFTDLSMDHTGANRREVARLQAQFPDEPNIIEEGRIFGMEPTRTFGDGMYKWPASLRKHLRDYFNGPRMPAGVAYSHCRDGPYITAEPTVVTMTIPESQISFVILATDGLWDTMSSEEAVGLVGRWLQWRADPEAAPPPPPPDDTGPVFLGRMQPCWYNEHKVAMRDENAAVHLIRNSLGGCDDEMVRAALTFRNPHSRPIRDDITVQVVFFGPKHTDSNDTGSDDTGMR